MYVLVHSTPVFGIKIVPVAGHWMIRTNHKLQNKLEIDEWTKWSPAKNENLYAFSHALKGFEFLTCVQL